MPSAPALRLQVLNNAPVNPWGEYVLYWMIANRRTTWNFSLDEAVSWAEKLNKPLLVLEALRAGYP
ncbi:MAG: deoxyribodipyrimidine photolyase, partial [Deltaproteobacteria bacterium]